MAKPTGFLEFGRELPTRRPVEDRVHDWLEVYEEFPVPVLQNQASRCMDCGIPFCHQGCPLGNMIPEVALVKTMWALGNSEDNDGLKKLLLENIASEFSE